MFTPPEIPLSGYNPPATDAYLPSVKPSSVYPHQYESTYAPPPPQPAPDFYKPCGRTQAPPPTYRKIDPSHVYGAQFPVQNFTPKPFTPSPISQEKVGAMKRPSNTKSIQTKTVCVLFSAGNFRTRTTSAASDYSSATDGAKSTCIECIANAIQWLAIRFKYKRTMVWHRSHPNQIKYILMEKFDIIFVCVFASQVDFTTESQRIEFVCNIAIQL